MTKVDQEYKFLLAKPGVTTGLDQSTNVDLEVTTTEGSSAHITGLQEWGGQRVRGVEAHAESAPWTVTLQESTNEEVTGKLASSTLLGADVMRRTVRLDVDSTGSYTPRAGGRVTDLAVNADEQTYEFTVRDELFKARTAGAFSSNDTQIIPRGISEDWWRKSDARTVVWEVFETDDETADVRPLRAGFNLTPNEIGELADDVVADPQPASSNFRNLRVRDEDAGSTWTAVLFSGATPNDPIASLRDSSGLTAAGFVRIHTTAYSSGNTFRGIMHAFGRDPSTVLPLHYGGSTGIDPMQFVQDRYDDAGVQTPSTLYQTHSTNNPNAVLGHPLKIDDLFIRVTEPTTNLQRYLEETIFNPLGVAPLVDDRGRVKPTYMRQPDSADIPETSNLFTFTSSNLAEYPTWDEGTNEQVTRLNAIHDLYFEENAEIPDASDLVEVRDFREEAAFNTTIFGEHSRRTRLHGYTFPLTASSRIASDSFQRFGYGPIRSRFRGMSDASTVRAGDFVVLDVPTFPKAPDAVRGGKQIFQVLSRTGTVRGPRFECLELGPEAQPLSAPNLNLTKSSTEPKHAVDLSVSSLSSGAEAQIRLAAQGTEPAGSSEWTIQDIVVGGTSTITRSQLPSGETIWGQARQQKSGRITSDWSTSASTVLDAITAPSNLSITSTDPNEASFTWTNGSTEYNTQIRLFSTDHSYHPEPRRVTKTAGSETAFVSGFGEDHTAGSSIDVQLVHVDRFGGDSAATTGTLVLGTTPKTSPSLDRFTISQGFFPTAT